MCCATHGVCATHVEIFSGLGLGGGWRSGNRHAQHTWTVFSVHKGEEGGWLAGLVDGVWWFSWRMSDFTVLQLPGAPCGAHVDNTRGVCASHMGICSGHRLGALLLGSGWLGVGVGGPVLVVVMQLVWVGVGPFGGSPVKLSKIITTPLSP